MNIPNTVMKYKFARKLGFKKLLTVSFEGFREKDQLKMTGYGFKKGESQMSIQVMDLKISENSTYEILLIRNAKSNAPNYKQWEAVQCNIYYEKNSIETTVAFTNVDDRKDFVEFKNNLED